MRKISRKGAIKKCHAMWSKCIHARDKVCLVCGRDHGKLDAHHGITARGNGCGPHWFELDNGFLLCFVCHQGAHAKTDKPFMERFLAKVDSMVSKERQEEIVRMRHTAAHYTIEDLEGIYERLAKEYDRIVGN